jgi:hypothetical protein
MSTTQNGFGKLGSKSNTIQNQSVQVKGFNQSFKKPESSNQNSK